MIIRKQQMTLVIACVAIVFASLVAVYYIKSMPNRAITTQSVQDADKAAETAETAAVSARKAADSTRATADSAEKSSTAADQAAKDASNSSARQPQGSKP